MKENCAVLVKIGSILRSTLLCFRILPIFMEKALADTAAGVRAKRTKAVPAGGGRTVVRFAEQHHRVGSFDL